MRRILAAGVVLGAVAALLATAAPASAALHEQIVFSGEANGTFDNVSTDANSGSGARWTRREVTTTAGGPCHSTA